MNSQSSPLPQEPQEQSGAKQVAKQVAKEAIRETFSMRSWIEYLIQYIGLFIAIVGGYSLVNNDFPLNLIPSPVAILLCVVGAAMAIGSFVMTRKRKRGNK